MKSAIAGGVSGQVDAISKAPVPSLYRQLHGEAHALLDRQDYSLAVVVAQIAAEVAVEQAIILLVARRGVPELAEPLSNVRNNATSAALYIALSGQADKAEKALGAVRTHAKVRNGVVHKGRRATQKQAEASLKAVGSLLDSIESVLSSPA